MTYNDNFDGIIAKYYEDAVEINVECQDDKFYLKLEDGPGPGYHLGLCGDLVLGFTEFLFTGLHMMSLNLLQTIFHMMVCVENLSLLVSKSKFTVKNPTYYFRRKEAI